MSTRITESQIVNGVIGSIQTNRTVMNKYSKQASSGLKVAEAGDSTFSGTIAELQTISKRLDTYTNRINYIEGYYTTQDDILSTGMDLLIRAKEVGTQAANETNSETERLALSAEIIQLKDEMISLANTKYQGQYIYSGTTTDQPAYAASSVNYTEGGEGTTLHYEYKGNNDVRTVQITDSLTIGLNSGGEGVFDNAIKALEKLSRSLQGYKTDLSVPPDDPGNVAYTFPDDYHNQTKDIQECLDLLDQARDEDLSPERVSVASRLNRIKAATSLINLNQNSTSEALSNLQDADLVEVATKFTLSQQALSASLAVTTRMMNISILDYI